MSKVKRPSTNTLLKEHVYEVRFGQKFCQIYTLNDNRNFEIILQKVIRLNNILESWICGLYYMKEDDKVWIDSSQDTVKSLVEPNTNEAGHIQLYVGVMTYPISLYNELWSHSVCQNVVTDIYSELFSEDGTANCKLEILPDIVAIEKLLLQRSIIVDKGNSERTISDEVIKQCKNLKEQFSDLTDWKLMKEFLRLLDISQYRKISASSICFCKFKRVSMPVRIDFFNAGFELFSSQLRIETKWTDIVKLFCEKKTALIIYKVEDENQKLSLKFPNRLSCQQFNYIFKMHTSNYLISQKWCNNEDFPLIRAISEKENENQEKILSLEKILLTNEEKIKEQNIIISGLQSLEKQRKRIEIQLKETQREIKQLNQEISIMKTCQSNQKQVYEEKIEGLEKNIQQLNDQIAELTKEMEEKATEPETERSVEGFQVIEEPIMEQEEKSVSKQPLLRAKSMQTNRSNSIRRRFFFFGSRRGEPAPPQIAAAEANSPESQADGEDVAERGVLRQGSSRISSSVSPRLRDRHRSDENSIEKSCDDNKASLQRYYSLRRKNSDSNNRDVSGVTNGESKKKSVGSSTLAVDEEKPTSNSDAMFDVMMQYGGSGIGFN